MTSPQEYLLRHLPDDGKWVDVPPAVRASTVLALVRHGVIEHRYKEPHHWKDWVVWGEVRKKV